MNSEPFDIGTTTMSALSPLKGNPGPSGYAQAVFENVEKENNSNVNYLLNEANFDFVENSQPNKNSVSNGSLMRCTPMAVWGCELSIQDFKLASNLDVSFTHKAPIVKEAVFAYQLGIKYLLNNPNEKDRAIKAYDFVA